MAVAAYVQMAVRTNCYRDLGSNSHKSQMYFFFAQKSGMYLIFYVSTQTLKMFVCVCVLGGEGEEEYHRNLRRLCRLSG